MERQGPFPTVTEMVNGDSEIGSSFSLHRTLKSLLPQICTFLGSLIILYVTEFSAVYFFGPGWRAKIPVFGNLSFRWFAIIPIFLLLELVRKYNDDVYILERDRIIHHAGLLSLTYNVPSIRYFDIRAIKINQGIIGRILNFGDIEISTAAQDSSEVYLEGIHAPLQLAEFIEEMRTWHHQGDSPPHYTRRPYTRAEDAAQSPALS